MYQIKMFRAADAGGAPGGTAPGATGADPTQGGTAATPPATTQTTEPPKTETTPPAKPTLNELLKDPAYKAEHDSMISAAAEAARTRAENYSKMTADERQAEERRQFDAERAEFAAERLENEATKQLAVLGLPVEFAKQLVGKDATATLANVQQFGTAFSAAVKRAVTDRIKGDPPRTGMSGSTGNTESEYKNNPYYGKDI